MSFASTPLGQGRRLDHHTFLKGASANPAQIHGAAHGLRAHPRQSTHNLPVSYAYGAPSQSTRSPPKPTQSEAIANVEEPTHASDSDQPALIRYARLKQAQESDQNQNTADVRVVAGSRVVNIPPNPDRWSVKDTSVNIASAFHRAANSTIIPAHDSSASNTSSSFNNSSIMNPNDSWASGMQRKQNLPRSTSVEYEKETQSTVNRRLGVPPNRNPVTRPQRPASRPMPAEEQENIHTAAQRAKSPLEHIVEATRRLAPATFLMRRQSEEPEPRPAPGVQDKSSSYDYSAEEREFQELSQQEQAQRKAASAAHRRNRISTDNKAYLPTQSDMEDSEEESEDDGRKGRKKMKKKTGGIGGPLTSLPVAGYDKRKKKRKGAKGTGADGEAESSEEEDPSYEQVTDERSGRTTSFLRTSVPPPSRRSVSRGSVPPEVGNTTSFIDAMDVENGLHATLHSIVEEDESAALDESVEVLSQQSFSVGALLGRAVHAIFSLFSLLLGSVWSALTYLPFLFGRALGHLIELVVLNPVRRISGIDVTPLVNLGKYITIVLALYAAWYALNSGLIGLPSRSTHTPPYHPPADIPPEDLSELTTRLLRLENVLSGLSLDVVRLREDARTHSTQIGAVEHQLNRESSHVYEVESKFSSATQGLQAVQQEVRSLHAEVVAQKERQQHQRPGPSADEEARRLLRELEQRVGTVEGGVKEALEVGKHASSDVPAGKVLEWWDKVASGKTSSLTIKSSDGKDVTGLINTLVDSAVSKMSKDTIARPDFALYSSGASVIPSLTSDTFEIKPQGLKGRVLGLVTGNGYAVGRPPVTALHHETHNGHCWPFAGDRGQLGIMLSMPAYISEVTIDHVPREVATDMRSAPRHMELWGFIEGEENTAKYNAWQAQRAAQKEEACAAAKASGAECSVDEDEFPKTLRGDAPYMRIASFTYNIYAPNHIQTFPVSPEIQELGIDFGVVALLVKSNWGREEFTCLYRVRIHGERLGDIPEPLPEEAAS